MIKTLDFTDDGVTILDQSLLPEKVEYIKCRMVEDVAGAIKALKVRGAPLIGVTAAFGLALAMAAYENDSDTMPQYFAQAKAQLASTRPTAVNLFWALERMEQVFKAAYNNGSRKQIGALLKDEAIKMLNEDIAVNQAIGAKGQELLAAGSRLMTICNAGALATCGYGTALGVGLRNPTRAAGGPPYGLGADGGQDPGDIDKR
jgi:methylthioribose-1-phosphate isomerase